MKTFPDTTNRAIMYPKMIKPIEHTINHHKKSKRYWKKKIQHRFLNECSLFSKPYTESLPPPNYAKPADESHIKIFPYLCIYTERLKLPEIQSKHNQIFPVLKIPTSEAIVKAREVLLMENVKLLNYYAIQMNLWYNDHYLAIMINAMNRIPAVLERNIVSSTYVSIIVVHKSIIFTNFRSSKITDSRYLKYFTLLNNYLRYTSNNKITGKVALRKNIVIIADKSTVENNSQTGTALSLLFSSWYFLNISHGLCCKSILKTININTISIIGDKLCLILCKNTNNNRVTMNFTSSIPLDEYQYLSYCMLLVYKTKCVTTDDEINCNIESSLLTVNQNKDTEFHRDLPQSFTKKTHILKYKDVAANTEIKTDFQTEHGIKIHQEQSLNFWNASIWLPRLCGDSYNDKISFTSYILKCSCLNKALVNLDVIEKHIKTICTITLSPTFNKVFMKDLGMVMISTIPCVHFI